MIYFITGNQGKFAEAKAVLGDIEMLPIDLPEIQDLDPHAIIKAKLQAAFEHHQGPMIVDDVGVYLDCLDGFPGPLIKWYLKALGTEKIVQICEKLGNTRATIKAIVGYANNPNEIRFFEGEVHGKIVMPRGDKGFGFDPIFLPDGYSETYSEMSPETKNQISHRGLALKKLKLYLDQ